MSVSGTNSLRLQKEINALQVVGDVLSYRGQPRLHCLDGEHNEENHADGKQEMEQTANRLAVFLFPVRSNFCFGGFKPVFFRRQRFVGQHDISHGLSPYRHGRCQSWSPSHHGLNQNFRVRRR